MKNTKIIKQVLSILMILAFLSACKNETVNKIAKGNYGTEGKIVFENETETVVEFEFTNDDQKTIKEYSFTLKDPLEMLQLTYTQEDDGDAIDFGFADDERIIGWSGGAKKEVTLSEHYSSTGYDLVALNAKTFKILFGVYKVANNSAKTTLTIKKTPYKERWLRGTIHQHTLHSDGKHALSEVIDLNKNAKFDYYFISDHNNTMTIKEAYHFRRADLLTIPSIEWTSWKGHANFSGVEKPLGESGEFRWFDRDASYYLDLARKNGAYISINHRFASGDSVWAWPWPKRSQYDWMEIWNKEWDVEYDQKILDWWTEQLIAGENIPVVGGSDFHDQRGKDELLNSDFSIMPINKVLASSFTQKGLLESIKAGRSIAFDANLVDDVTFTSEKGVLGTTTDETKVKIDIQNLRGEYDVILVTENGRQPVASNVANLNQIVDVNFNKFCYLLIVNKEDTRVAAISNPIYR